MPATATAPARSPRTRGRQASTRLVPVAVGRTAGAVGGIADSGLVVRLTRGRLWIGLLGALLVGIVGLNVVALSFSARSSESARKAEALEQRNSALRGQLASLLSTDELQAAATSLGLLTPAPDAINYVKASGDEAELAAKRLRSGELTTVDSAPVVADSLATVPTTDSPVTDTPAAEVPVEPAADPAVDDPGTTAPETEGAVEPTTADGAILAP